MMVQCEEIKNKIKGQQREKYGKKVEKGTGSHF